VASLASATSRRPRYPPDVIQLLDHDQLGVWDLIGEGDRASWGEGGVLGPVNDQGGYLDLYSLCASSGSGRRRWDG